MKKSYLTAVFMLTCSLGVGVSARAQDVDAVVVSVPFQFVAGGATLTAGEYRIIRSDPDVTRELLIVCYNIGVEHLYFSSRSTITQRINTQLRTCRSQVIYDKH